MSEQALNILVINNHTDSLLPLTLELQRSGHRVHLARNGQEALDKAAQLQPVLSLFELGNPPASGYELCQNLRRQHPFMYIIILSSPVKESDRIAALEAGADDYILEPYSQKELILRIQTILRRIQTYQGTGISQSQAASAAGPVSIAALFTEASLPAGRTIQPAIPLAAQPDYDQIQRTRQKNLEAILRRASEAAQLQDIVHARELYNSALKLDPTNEAALMWLSWYSTDPYEGCSYLEKLVAAHPGNTRAREYLEAGRKRIQELDALISDSNVFSNWHSGPDSRRPAPRNKSSTGTLKPSAITPIGQMLLKRGYITKDQLDSAVNLHEMFSRLDAPKKLGEILLEYGYVTREQLRSVLSEQEADFNSTFN